MEALPLLEMLRSITWAPATQIAAQLKESAFTRKRKMTFPMAVSFLLDMRKTTLQTRLNLYYDNMERGDPISQQAFSKLRMQFDHSPFETMFRETVKAEYSGEYELPLWHGYHVLAVDGSLMQLPRVKALLEEYGSSGRGSICPSAGISTLFDVLHGWPIDTSIEGAKRSERTAFEKHIEFVCRELPHIAKKSIVLLDRGYPSEDLIKKLQAMGLKFLMRCNSQFLKPISNAPLGDSICKLKSGTTLRVYKFALPSGEIETLITNEFELEDKLLEELYGLRWGVESYYFKLKREICVEKFSGKTANSIRQDYWASMVLMISVAVFQAEADKKVRERSIGKSIYERNARTSDLIVTLRDRFIFAVLCGRPMLASFEMKSVIKTMARSVSYIRPGRSFERKPKPAYNANANLKSTL